jgi:RNA polymerase sigma-70 factor (ECF subfamily)
MGVKDPSKFVKLLVEHQFRLYSFIFLLVPNQADADDLMQETSMALWEMFDRFQPGGDFTAWACSIARYRVLKYLERKRNSPLLMGKEVLERVARETLARSDELEARRKALSICVGKLVPRDRELLEKIYDPINRTLKQAAEKLGRPVNTIYKAVSRIHRLLYACVRRTLNIARFENHG